MRLLPPKWVPGPFRPPSQPPGIPTQRLPGVRYFHPQGNETLAEIAQQFYGNSREATRVFNANRAGTIRADKSDGFLLTLNDLLPAGVPIVIP